MTIDQINLLQFDIQVALFWLEKGNMLLGIKWTFNLAADYLYIIRGAYQR